MLSPFFLNFVNTIFETKVILRFCFNTIFSSRIDFLHIVSYHKSKVKMNEVWYILKIMELGLGCICTYYHTRGIQLEEETANHSIIYCGTFFGFSIITSMGNLATCLLSPPSLLLESIIGSMGFVFYTITCFFSMYHCELDTHLSYMSDQEELRHQFFIYTRNQGLSSLTAAAIFLVHGVFAFDAFISSRSKTLPDEEKLDLNIMIKPWGELLSSKKFIRRIFFVPENPVAEPSKVTK